MQLVVLSKAEEVIDKEIVTAYHSDATDTFVRLTGEEQHCQTDSQEYDELTGHFDSISCHDLLVNHLLNFLKEPAALTFSSPFSILSSVYPRQTPPQSSSLDQQLQHSHHSPRQYAYKLLSNSFIPFHLCFIFIISVLFFFFLYLFYFQLFFTTLH